MPGGRCLAGISAVRGWLLLCSGWLCTVPAVAGTPVMPGDIAMRQDIQLLADHGVLGGPVTTWPLAWEPIRADIEAYDDSGDLPVYLVLALDRVRHRAERETAPGLDFAAGVSAAENPARLRSFAHAPRESGEARAGLSWSGSRFRVQLAAQAVRSPDDGKNFRGDGSAIAANVGNFTIAAGQLDRWWGPGWDSSLILSSNARPIPALTIDRDFTRPFESRWLNWLGPWDVSVIFGQMESDRAVPDARFFGVRANFRPLRSLEVGISRSAQWCGDGRPCDLQTFVDLLAGRDNRGGDGISTENEPGNQLAGFDMRWSAALLRRPFALYGQLIGEDEAGGFPSRYLAQAGIETWGRWQDWSWRLFSELAGTSCDFVKEDIFNCGYNHSIYETGYRYRNRAVGHTADNDAKMLTAGVMLVQPDGRSWWAIARSGDLNRGGPDDPRNSLTGTAQSVLSLDVQHSRPLPYGVLDIGLGFESVDDAATGETTSDGRFFLEWRNR